MDPINPMFPSGGRSFSETFTFRWKDANGWSNIRSALVIVNQTLAASNSCHLWISPQSNHIRLLNDTASAWSAPGTPGAAGSFSNSQCTLDLAGAAISGSADGLAVTVPLTFAQGFNGAKNAHMLAEDESGASSNWQLAGTWTVGIPATQGTPAVVSMSPSSGSGSSGTFTAVYSHSGGASQLYLGYMLFLPIPNVVWYTAQGSCLIEYNRISHGIRLINDAGNGWLGPVSGVPITPAAAPLSNSFCTVQVSGASATVSGNNMTVTIPVTFKSNFTGVLPMFLQAADVTDKWTGMTQMGSWTAFPQTVPKPGPYFVSTTPTSGAGSSATFSITVGHTGGVSRLSMVHLLLNSVIVGGAACQVVFLPSSNQVNLINDSGTDMASPVWLTPGSSTGSVANSRCAISGVGLTRVTVGNNVTLNVPLTFQPAAFGGLKNIYVNTFDNAGLLTHWVQPGTWQVQ
jgi:hypothetical protein